MNSGAPFPFTPMFQNGPRRPGFAPPRKTRAPWTAYSRPTYEIWKQGEEVFGVHRQEV